MSRSREAEAQQAKIAQLEAEVSRLKAEARVCSMPEHEEHVQWSWEATTDCPRRPFVVADASELRMCGAHALAIQVLDALPTSVFVKEAELVIDSDGASARRYTFMNSRARSPLAWAPGQEVGRLDSEAFDPAHKQMHALMVEQESKTLKNNEPRETLLDWAAPDGFGRRARTREIPIVCKSNPDTPIGFCAIADERRAEVYAQVLAQFFRWFHHEYNNLQYAQYIWVERAITHFRALGSQAARLADPLSAEDHIVNLRRVSEMTKIANNTIVTLSKAFIGVNAEASVESILGELSEVFCASSGTHSPYDLHIEATREVESVCIAKSAAAIGAVAALVQNAYKHTAYDPSDLLARRQIKVVVDETRESVRWTIKNKGTIQPGIRLNLASLEEMAVVSPEAVRVSTGTIVRELLQAYSFERVEIERMVDQPRQDGALVVVAVSFPRAHSL